MKEKLVVLIILVLFLGSGTLLLINAFSLPKNTASLSLPTVKDITQTLTSWMTSLEPTDVTPPTPTPRPTRPPNPTPSPPPAAPKPQPTDIMSQPLLVCYRYTIPHLDGSSSTLCYEANDYKTLQQLGATYRSAKTFYEFHINGVADYQAMYEKTGSEIYLDAKQSQQNKANVQKAIMDSTLIKMYTIEQRGIQR